MRNLRHTSPDRRPTRPRPLLEPLEQRRHFATDVAVSITKVSAEEVNLSGKFNVTAVLENLGTTTINDRSVNVRVYASTDKKFSSSDRLLTDNIRALDGFTPGETLTTKIPVVALADMTPRAYNLIAVLNPNGPDG